MWRSTWRIVWFFSFPHLLFNLKNSYVWWRNCLSPLFCPSTPESQFFVVMQQMDSPPLMQHWCEFCVARGYQEDLAPQTTGLPTGLSVTWLGTSSGSPTRYRNVSSIACRFHHATYLVDAGEGTQRQLIRADISPGLIKRWECLHSVFRPASYTPGWHQFYACRISGIICKWNQLWVPL